MADSLVEAIRDVLAADPLTAGLAPTQGQGKAVAAPIYAVARLKSWTPSFRSSDATWYDARVELRFHAPTPEAAESAASLAETVLGSAALGWSIGGSTRPLDVARRAEPVKGYAAGSNYQAIHCLDLLYKAEGMPGAESADIVTASAYGRGGYGTFPYPA